MYICMDVLYVCMYVWMYCMYECIYVWMYICMHKYVDMIPVVH